MRITYNSKAKDHITWLKNGQMTWIDIFQMKTKNGQQIPANVLNMTNQIKTSMSYDPTFLIKITRDSSVVEDME